MIRPSLSLVVMLFALLSLTTTAESQQDLPKQPTLSQAIDIALSNNSIVRTAQSRLPPFFQTLSYLDPLRYFVTIIRGVTIKDAPFSAIWPNLAALAAFSIILFTISALRFRKQ